MSPDFQYFLLGHISSTSHSLPGLFRFCLPVGLASWLLFQFLLKRPLALLLPANELGRLWTLASHRISVSIATMIAGALGVTVGAATHLIWDSFTHGHGWVVQRIPALSRSIVVVGGYDFTVFKLLQHGSTVVGILLLLRAYLRWRRDSINVAVTPLYSTTFRGVAIGLIFAVPAIAALAYALPRTAPVSDLASLRPFLWHLITSGLCFGGITLIVYSLGVTLTMRRRHDEAG